tara:strand:+ start:1502 stop:2566 length:1065 start_codon:yes stop_codon:yes gene_type:complete
MNIGSKKITDKGPVYFIADIGANHDGDLLRAKKLIKLASEAGADAVKFQHFKAETIVSAQGFEDIKDCLPMHQRDWKKSVFETYKEASINTKWNLSLKEYCDEFKVEFMTSPYDLELAREINPLLDTFKIGSGDISWMEIVEELCKYNKNLIVATGASSIEDVRRIYKKITSYGNKLCIMQCNTNYTGDSENLKYINLNVLKQYQKEFPKAILGLSDHTHGSTTVIGAVTLGARIIEKHFTDDNNRDGPDHKFAMNPESWADMVSESKKILLSLGDGIKKVEENELLTYIAQRRSIYAKNDITAGVKISKDDLIALRPNQKESYPVEDLESLIGKTLINNIKKGHCIKLANVSK